MAHLVLGKLPLLVKVVLQHHQEVLRETVMKLVVRDHSQKIASPSEVLRENQYNKPKMISRQFAQRRQLERKVAPRSS
jgi:hypothetical protein